MATTLEREGCLEISNIAADWSYVDNRPAHWPVNPRLASIEFHPGGSDVMAITQGNDQGALRFYANCQDAYDSRIKYFHGSRCRPFIDFSECSLTAAHKVIIELWRAP